MKVEGVTFNEELVRNIKKKDFIDMHKRVFYLDRSIENRETLLSDIYDKICGNSNRSRSVESAL